MPSKGRNGTVGLSAAAALSVLSAIGANLVLDHASIPSGWMRLAVGLVPLPFFIAFILAEFRWMQNRDEFHRRVMLESLAIAFPAAIALGVFVEALQKAGFFTRLTIGDVWPYMALVWLPSMWIAARRYRVRTASDEE